MLNWRKPVINLLLGLSDPDVMKTYNFIHDYLNRPEHDRSVLREKRLTSLLKHAYENCVYYKEVLGDCKVINGKNNDVCLENFSKIPFLTKDIMRKESARLESKIRYNGRYINTSGGSTGEAVSFTQDNKYKSGDIAATLFLFLMAGKDIGEKEVKLWGSERDIFEGSEKISDRIKNWLYNRTLLNSFRMTPDDLRRYVNVINERRPVVIWSYIDSIYETAKFIEKNKMQVHSPVAIIVTAGNAYDWMKEFIEKVFRCKVLNQYGSREVGAIACECPAQHGLHVFDWRQKIEIVDKDGENCPDETEGEIVITNLENYSMPFIRFKIGDMGAVRRQNECKYTSLVLSKLTGRITDHFILKNGALIHGEYFTHLFYFRPWIKTFKVVQKDYDRIVNYIVLCGEKNNSDLKDIADKMKLVMGADCRVEFEYCEDIPRSKSGKYLFTMSEVYRR